MKQPGIVICSRINSKRIPKKPLQKINGVSIIRLLVERLLRGSIPICVALPESSENDVIIDAIHEYPIEFYHGSENNVLDRFFQAARMNKFDPIIRITHDDILTDTDIMMDMIEYHKLQHADYTYIRKIIRGTDCEIINFSTVEKAVNNYFEIEHLSYAFKKYSDKICEFKPILKNYNNDVNLSIDYLEDLKIMQCVYDVIGYNNFDIDTLKTHLDTTLKNVINFNRRPKITIYTCVFNGENTIARTINSVLDQGFVDFEYIICDDGSTDSTREILWKYINDSRIKFIIKDKNTGLAASSNKVLETAKGEYYIRIDADDEFTDVDSVLKLYQKMESNSHAAICYGYYIEKYIKSGICDDGKKWTDCGSEIINENTEHHIGCAIINARAFHEIKFNNNLRHFDGYDFYLRAKEKFDILFLDKPVWIYHQSKNSLSKSDTEERNRVKKEIEVCNGTTS